MNKNLYKPEFADILMNYLISRHSFSFITEWLGINYLSHPNNLRLSKDLSPDSSLKADVKEIRQLSDEPPGQCRLYQNSPNPFSEKTIINFQCSCNSFVSLKIYDISWNEISTLVNKKLESGTYQVEFSATGGGRGLPGGVYFYRLTAGEFTDMKRMMLVK